ncbi:MAG TPA: HAMP domain-containing sensor histidine kinase [Thermoanaerobaculia bacterium]|nr:HAMP domain-containing sensor histidine kinase [Thermoanaerobaculia bacterium]
MTWRIAAATLGGMLLAAAAVLWIFERQISNAWFRLGHHPGTVAALERSLADQKELARLDPQRRDHYRSRFDEIQRLLQRLRIVEHNRAEIVRRYEMVLLAAVGGVLLAAGGVQVARQRRQERRLQRLRDALVALAAGGEGLEVGVGGRDTLGRIAGMVEDISRAVARDRRRLASLNHLSAWQEAARRHAHEMKTPLTAAHLELQRLQRDGASAAEVRQAAASLAEELERLARFTRHFTSFARLPRPRLGEHDLGEAVAEFAAAFAWAWPGLTLNLQTSLPAAAPVRAAFDREMLRQVLVNLCDNSARALSEAGREGNVEIRIMETADAAILEVADDGPGIPPAVRPTLFEPYVTTRAVGEGMGLGLAISRKILLDHGGDLELVETATPGAVFRLTLSKRVRQGTAA